MADRRFLPAAVAMLLATSLLSGLLTGLSLIQGAAPAHAASVSDPNSAPGTYRAVAATRLLDTRSGIGAPRHAVAARGVLALTVAGRGGVPATGVAAVVLNVTETQAARSGYLTVYPGGSGRPLASNVSFPAGQTVANLVTVRLGAGGTVDIYNGTSGPVGVLADIRGYYLAGPAADPGAFTSMPPTRVLDTRSGNGAPAHAVAGRAVLSVQLSGREGIPATGVASVVLNLTATQQQGSGYLTAYGDGARPTTSNLNFVAGRTVAGLVTVPLTATGAVNLYVGSSHPVQLIADVAGYLLSGTPSRAGAVVTVTPTRLLDTRCGVQGGTCSIISPGKFFPLWPTTQVLGRAGIPSSGVAEVIFDLTATQANVPGYLALATGDPNLSSSIPATSDVNFTTGHTAANQVISPVDTNGQIRVYFGAANGNVSVIVDVVGYVLAPSLTWSSNTVIDPQHGPTHYLSCADGSFCAGLDTYGNARTFDGSTWSAPTPVLGVTPAGVSCPTSTFCVAAGRLLTGSVYSTYDGHSWSAAQALSTTFVVGSISCPTSTFCVAISPLGLASTYTGGSWSAPVATGATSGVLAPVSCASASFCALGDRAGKFITYDGTSWSVGLAPTATISRLSCATATFCAAVGVDNKVETYDGTSWTTTTLGPATVTGLACRSATRCVAVTSSGQAATYDGVSWSALSTVLASAGGDNSFAVLSCGAVSSCVSVTPAGRSLTYNGSQWSAAVPSQPTNPLSSVSCPTTSFCLATDADGAAMTYDGGSWSAPATVLPGHARSHAACATAQFCVVVDEAGEAASFDGSHWSAAQTPDPGHALTAVSCPGEGHCVAVDSSGSAVSYDGTWSVPASVGGAGRATISCPAAGACVAFFGQDQYLLKGGVWSGPEVVMDGASALSCVSMADCVTVSGQSSYTFDGTAWRALAAPLAAVTDLSCVNAGFCVGVAASGSAFYGQAGWVSAQGPFDGVGTASVSCPTDRFCVAVSSDNLASVGSA